MMGRTRRPKPATLNGRNDLEVADHRDKLITRYESILTLLHKSEFEAVPVSQTLSLVGVLQELLEQIEMLDEVI